MDQISYYTLKIGDNVQFQVAVGTQFWDPIGQAIADQTYSFPPVLNLAFKLLQPTYKVIDLGVHLGTFSLGAAALGCAVLAVEASPYNAALVRASIARNQFDHVQIITAAVSDAPGTVEFVEGGPFGSVANPFMQGSKVHVPSVTVDALLAEMGWNHVDFIKMDIEGSEVAAIRGMSHLLARDDAPLIIYESNGHTLRFFGETPNRLIAALEGFGYKNYRIKPRQFVPVRSDELQPECNVDYLAIKHPLSESIGGWQVVPMTLEETINQTLASCADDIPEHRAYIARALATADQAIVLDPRVMKALESMRMDPDPTIQTAASWFDFSRMESIALPAQMGALLARLESLKSRTDIMLRGYSVQSQVPVIGGLIAWVRRNLTSHLREPYLDPIIERQVEFNCHIWQEIHNIAAIQALVLQQLARLETQLSSECGSMEKHDSEK